MVGMERTILPAIAERDFRLAARAAIFSFIVVFGVTKAPDELRRRTTLRPRGRELVPSAAGSSLFPVPPVLMGPGLVLAANVLLGVSQGLTWSTTVIMKVDLSGPEEPRPRDGPQRVCWLLRSGELRPRDGICRFGLWPRPQPFYLGIAFAVIGLFLSLVFVRETRITSQWNCRRQRRRSHPSNAEIFARTTWRDPNLSR